jgi:hypothetical protein
VAERRPQIDLQRHGALVVGVREILEEGVEVEHSLPRGQMRVPPFPGIVG